MYIVMHYVPAYNEQGSQIGFRGDLRCQFSALDMAKKWCLQQCKNFRHIDHFWEVSYVPVNIVVEKFMIEVVARCRWNAPNKQVDERGFAYEGQAEWKEDDKLRWKLADNPKEPYIQLAYDLLNRDPIVLDICEEVMHVQLTRKKRRRRK